MRAHVRARVCAVRGFVCIVASSKTDIDDISVAGFGFCGMRMVTRVGASKHRLEMSARSPLLAA